MSWWTALFPLRTHGEPVERRLRRAEPRPIASFDRGGEVCIAGKVEPLGPLLDAPLTGRRCVFWAVSVAEIGWTIYYCRERANRSQGDPFLLIEGMRRARVIPDGAMVALPFHRRFRAAVAFGSEAGMARSGATEPQVMSGPERALYDSLQIRIAPTSRVRLTEYVIEPEMAIVVQGHAEQEPDDQAAEVGYREAPTRLVVSSARRAPLLIGLPPRP